MAGFTIIHLSDLHIGKFKENPQVLADVTGERLAYDLKTISDKYEIPFHTHETLLMITGDITDQATWEQYEVAIKFIHQLQYYFKKYFENDGVLSEHIICIPGNHDLIIPRHRDQFSIEEKKTKYAYFNLFLNEITSHSSYAKRFNLDCPFVNLLIHTPFQLQVIDLNTTLNIDNYEDPKPFITKDHLKQLEEVLQSQSDDVLRISLMHHQLAEFQPEDSEQYVSQNSIRRWLINNNFILSLCGHAHHARGSESRPFGEESSLFEFGTGPSFPQEGPRGKGNYYQIIRLEPSTEKNIKVVRRKYAWTEENVRENYWNEEPTRPFKEQKVPRLSEIMFKTDYRNFIGIGETKKWCVIAHCSAGKFTKWGRFSPGEEINASLIKLSDARKGELDIVNEEDQAEWEKWNKYSGFNALFLVDSPHYNPYVRKILQYYGTYLAGGSVEFLDVHSKPVEQMIRVHFKEYHSDKDENMDLFDKFTDYFLIMRLPAFFPNIGNTKVEVSDIDKKKVIWIIAGIHSKASYAGAKIFTPLNMERFENRLKEESGGVLPEYFEAIFQTPQTPEVITDFNALNLNYLKILKLKKEIGIADDPPSGVTVRFLDKNIDNIPIDTVHFDPVAACNFNCPHCIEKDSRDRNLFLSINTCLNILCDLKEVKCQNLNFYGGEPTLHPDFDKILRLSTNLGFNMLLVTNGSRLGEGKIRKAIINAKNRIHLRLSIDANSLKLHQKNHGLIESSNYYDNIIYNASELIKQDVSITISFLLHKESIREIRESCKYWKEKHASAFLLRPITGLNGKEPLLDYNKNDKNILLNIINDYKEFVYTPNWFEHWLTGESIEVQSKEYDRCYSGYYRIAISPDKGTRQLKEIIMDGIKMTETDNAWISLCTYNRFNPDYGCSYPDNLKDWSKTNRDELLANINPKNQCREVMCCRHKYNRHIYDIISKQPTTK